MGALGKRRQYSPRRKWEQWSLPRLMQMRLCDLDLDLEGTWVAEVRDQVVGELRSRDLRLKPQVYLADEWMSPDDLPAVAVPFYLVSPRLMRLERSRMLDVEGSSNRGCLKLMRHEMGHAVQHAYQLQRRPRFRRMFGKLSAPYPESYRPNPTSKRYVQHLDGYYAQAHPVEDFAETFAVWLGSRRTTWRRRYAGWPALRKLMYVDELMEELGGRAPVVRSRARPFELGRLKQTLAEYYETKQAVYAPAFANGYDRDLRRLFDGAPGEGEAAATFLRRNRRQIRTLVARWTGEYTFTVDQVLKHLIGRATQLKLRTRPGWTTETDFAVMLTVHSMTYLYRGREEHAV